MRVVAVARVLLAFETMARLQASDRLLFRLLLEVMRGDQLRVRQVQ